MNSFVRSVIQVFQGAVQAFINFPAAIACAAAFTAVTFVRIYLNWPAQTGYIFLFDCLQWSLAFGAIFSLAVITAAQSRFEEKQPFILANLLGILSAAVAFGLLFIWGGKAPEFGNIASNSLSDLALARLSVATFVSFLAFIVFAGLPKEKPDLVKSLFMTHKAFFIALIYGMVLLSGVSGVAGAVQALLYQGMSYKVYSYIAALAGFFTFAIFVGYFPDFHNGESDERRTVAEKQPRFIEILFGYIMIPIMIALTIVLLLWTGRIVLEGIWPSFWRLSGIATSYAVFGIWLHAMTTHHETKLAVFYRRIYPFAALIILGFEAWALVVQLEKTGLKTVEYYFCLTWLFAVVSVVLLLLFKESAHLKIFAWISILMICSVLPVIGYNVLPVKAQTARLEKLLIGQNMLVDSKLVPAAAEPPEKVKEGITDAVSFLANESGADLPVWFEKKFTDGEVFKSKFGFRQTWPRNDSGVPAGNYLATNLYVSSQPIDITGFNWVIKPPRLMSKGTPWGEIKGSRGLYKIIWTLNYQDGMPSLKIMLNENLLLEQNLNDYFNKIAQLYPPGKSRMQSASLADMSLNIETPEVRVLLVFNDVHINVNVRDNKTSYVVNVEGIYLQEKP
ncbi:MAG: DUF4153 domain-containing protein [Acidaminococcaceae bacterium]